MRYVGILKIGGSPQGDDDDGVYVNVPKGMHEALSLQRDILEGPESNRMPNGKTVPGATLAYRPLRAGLSKKRKMVREYVMEILALSSRNLVWRVFI